MTPSPPNVTAMPGDWSNGDREAQDQLLRAVYNELHVELRFLSGLSVEQTPKVLDVSARTVKRDWNAAKASLRRELTRGGPQERRNASDT